MNWLKKLFGRRPVDISEVPIETVIIEPDPDMQPGDWEWECCDCPASGTGESQDVRAESMTHCLTNGHAVLASARSEG